MRVAVIQHTCPFWATILSCRWAMYEILALLIAILLITSLGVYYCSHYRGRGSFEAMGAGLKMSKGDVAFKCNFATVKKNEDGQTVVERRRVDRNFMAWGTELCSFLDGLTLPEFPGLVVSTKYATEHRCGIVFKGPGLCDKITGTDPLKDK